MNIGEYEKIFKSQIDLVEMEITVSDMKMSFDGIIGRRKDLRYSVKMYP